MEVKKDLKSKDYIVKTAFILFLQKGYKEVTIKNIMEATNLSKGAIYHHFKSKEEIYFSTLDIYYLNLLQTDYKYFQSGNFVEDIRLLYNYVSDMFANIENLTKEGLEYPIRNFYNFQLESEKNEIIRSKISPAIEQSREIIRKIVLTASESGQIKKDLDIESVTFQIIALIEGIAIHHSMIRNNVKKELMNKYHLIFDSYLKLICADE
ncbi:MAG: TetR/AcrR family transcriptional regulator [Bacteroidota bacterium]